MLGENISVLPSGVKNPKEITTTGCVITQKNAVLLYIAAEAWNLIYQVEVLIITNWCPVCRYWITVVCNV